ncbi:acylphosphatase [Halalkalibacter krulwichiae]|uniref:acylphosphatase n=1 Tax=Halalkalibacter krulwichiae TaxID=199441 RepID=A0A1X9MFI1_9BACI|nr:acylphosphatase [Halalkalibacter krulwichiae]ARK32209.1 Cyanophycin synthetase [Halalkalibacter krulwichiae]
MNQRIWLPHLEGAIPPEAHSDNLSMYTIALEGWRRGLTLKFYSVYKSGDRLKIRYSLSYQGREHFFSHSLGDKITEESIKVCKSKELTKQTLTQAGVPVPKGRNFTSEHSIDEMIEFAKTVEFPLVAKPTNGSLGRGVIVNIANINSLREALVHIRETLQYDDIIIEQHVEGEECRIYVIEDQVIGAANRIPAHIIGDGKSTVKELIDLKNKHRKTNPSLSKRLIKIDDEVLRLIESTGYTLDSIPKQGEQLFLREKSNLSAGGDPVDFTPQLTEETRAIAVQAAKAAGLAHCGLDMIIDTKRNTGVVIEVNSRAHIGSIMFPERGEGRDVPKAIIDYYFPETVGSNIENVYFNYKTIVSLLRSGVVGEFIVPSAPSQPLVQKSYLLTGKVQGVGYRRFLQRKAISFRLHGFAENLKDKKLLVVVAGTKEDILRFDEFIKTERPLKATVKSIQEQEWTKAVNVGFEVLGENKPKLPVKLKRELQVEREKNKQLTEEMTKLEEKYNLMKRKYRRIEESLSWRITRPIRKLKIMTSRGKR